VDKPPDKMAALLRYLRDNPGKSGIVYCTTRKTVEEVCQKLRTAGFPATRYHAGLSPEERRDNQEDFLYDRAPLMVATNAFGMGIDKSNVAFVLHYNMPGSMEAYYQEAGRAGRDGQPAQCILYYSGQDVATNRFLIEHGEGAPDADEETTARLREQDKERLKQMTFYCHTADCLREYILRYFGETPENYCGNCGNCSRNFEEADVTCEAQLLVEGIARTGQRFGAKMVLDILRGSGNARILSGGFDKLPVYGKLAGVGEKRLRAILQFLELRGEHGGRVSRAPAAGNRGGFDAGGRGADHENRPGGGARAEKPGASAREPRAVRCAAGPAGQAGGGAERACLRGILRRHPAGYVRPSARRRRRDAGGIRCGAGEVRQIRRGVSRGHTGLYG